MSGESPPRPSPWKKCQFTLSDHLYDIEFACQRSRTFTHAWKKTLKQGYQDPGSKGD